MEGVFKGKLTRGSFSTSEMTLRLKVTGQNVRRAQGHIDLTDKLMWELIEIRADTHFEFVCSDGRRFNLLIPHANISSPSVMVTSSGKIPGLLD